MRQREGKSLSEGAGSLNGERSEKCESGTTGMNE